MASDNPDLLLYARLVKTIVPNTVDEAIAYPSELKAHLLTIEAFDVDDDELSIFVFQREVFDPYETESSNAANALFSHVCSPNDLQELTIGLPEDETITLFRYHKVEALVRSLAEADYAWEEIKKDVQALITHHKLLLNPPENTTQIEEVEIE